MTLTDKEAAEKYKRMLERRAAYYQTHKAARLKYQRDYYYRTRKLKRKKEPNRGS